MSLVVVLVEEVHQCSQVNRPRVLCDTIPPRLEHVAAEHGMTGLELFGYKPDTFQSSEPVVRRMQRVPVVTDTLQPYNLVATGNK